MCSDVVLLHVELDRLARSISLSVVLRLVWICMVWLSALV
jgi:hypothetical protein